MISILNTENSLVKNMWYMYITVDNGREKRNHFWLTMGWFCAAP
jgi:hypothetical protein